MWRKTMLLTAAIMLLLTCYACSGDQTTKLIISARTCTEDGQCLAGERCRPVEGQEEKYCQSPCKTDEDCNYKCIDGYCQVGINIWN